MTGGVGVVVLDLDQHGLTARCLRSLATGGRLPDRVVLVENGTASFDVAADPGARSLQIVVLHPGRNLGCGGGRNLGLNYLVRNTTLSTVVVLDNDAMVPPDFIERVVSKPPKPLEVLAPVIFWLSSDSVWSSGGSIDRRGDAEQLDDDLSTLPEYRSVDWAPGTCLIMHRDTWLRVGEFDTSFHFFFEDIEWCRRLVAFGGHVRVVRDLHIEHEPHQSLGGAGSPNRARLEARNEMVFRICIAEVGTAAVLIWLVKEALLAVRELTGGRLALSGARASGLLQGLGEVRRRRLSVRSRYKASIPVAVDDQAPVEEYGPSFQPAHMNEMLNRGDAVNE